MSRTDVGRVKREAAEFLIERLGNRIVTAFLYGSVVTGRATSASDIDCLVVVAGPLDGSLATRIGQEFADLQRRLGHTADPEHPIEIFTIDDCRRAIDGDTISRALDQLAAAGTAEPSLLLSDELEILRALTGPRVTLVGRTALDQLAAQARDATAAGLASRRKLDPDKALVEFGLPGIIGRIG